jgi:hypothetical protein
VVGGSVRHECVECGAYLINQSPRGSETQAASPPGDSITIVMKLNRSSIWADGPDRAATRRRPKSDLLTRVDGKLREVTIGRLAHRIEALMIVTFARSWDSLPGSRRAGASGRQATDPNFWIRGILVG